MRYECVMSVMRVCCKCVTSVLLVRYEYFMGVLPVCYKCVISVFKVLFFVCLLYQQTNTERFDVSCIQDF